MDRYFCGFYQDNSYGHLFQELPFLLYRDMGNSRLHSISYYQTDESIATVVNKEDDEWEKIQLFWKCHESSIYKTLFEHYFQEYSVTPKTIQIRFNIISEIESGTFGKVFKVEDKLFKRKYAIKKVQLDGYSIELQDKKTSSTQIKGKVEIFHVFEDRNGFNCIYITSDQKVFGFGENLFGSLGLGHNSSVEEPKLISDLCRKNINQFFIGSTHVLALNTENRVYGWGRNSFGQLGRGFIDDQNKLFRPKPISNFDNTIQLSCGSNHSLALTSNGLVYGWGDNTYGQTGCGEIEGQIISMPSLLLSIIDFEIKAIYCLSNKSIALTSGGLVLSWGQNRYCELGHDLAPGQSLFQPKRIINLHNIKSIALSESNSYFLTKEGRIQFCGQNENSYQKSPQPIGSDIIVQSLDFIPLYKHNREQTSVSVAVSDKCVYVLKLNQTIEQKYKTLFDFFSKKYNICDKTVVIQINNNKYKNNFGNEESIGKGSSRDVYKVTDKSKSQFAIKQIKFNDFLDRTLREIRIHNKVNSEFVVNIYDTWVENHSIRYIKMELCFDNLANIISEKPKCFGRKPSEVMNSIEFFISCQLFKELLECVRYLHELDPQIIHRDLKPQNILIKEKPQNGRFLKLCDFGLSTEHNSKELMAHTSRGGTPGYYAPETTKGFYTTKADIYSLGKIAQQLFGFTIKRKNVDSIGLKPNRQPLKNIIKKMTDKEPDKRPTCAEVLTQSNVWLLTFKKVKKSDNYSANLTKLDEMNDDKNKNKFFPDYFHHFERRHFY